MENTDLPVEQQANEKQEIKTVEEIPTEETKTETETETKTETIEETTAERESVTETEMVVPTETPKEVVEEKLVEEEKTKEEVIPEIVETLSDDTGKLETDEQENVTTTTNTNGVTPAGLSPGRVNIPLKEVNESEKEETNVITNPTETTISKKRELEQEEPHTEENGTDSDERTADQTKKLKTDPVDTAIIEPKEIELNPVANGTAGIEA